LGWIIFLAVAIPLLALVAWVVFDDSFVQIEPGQLGLLLVRGRATDRALDPGPHWVPALRRRMVQLYPSLELSFRTGLGASAPGGDLERTGPAPRVLLGDRVTVVVAYTVRFHLNREMLRDVHNRFGPDGIWTAVRDETARTIRTALAHPDVGVDDLFGPPRAALEERVGEEVRAVLAGLGFVLTMFSLGDLDLGRTGDVVQATARARHELEREQAESAMRLARAKIDAELAPYLGTAPTDAAIRYREVDSWQEFARTTGPVAWPLSRAAAADAPVSPEATPPEQPAQDEQ
jgi:regulator of protease activity HflC (stomatin/prohibitin superfamily)